MILITGAQSAWNKFNIGGIYEGLYAALEQTYNVIISPDVRDTPRVHKYILILQRDLQAKEIAQDVTETRRVNADLMLGVFGALRVVNARGV